jgi:hypothetical protein
VGIVFIFAYFFGEEEEGSEISDNLCKVMCNICRNRLYIGVPLRKMLNLRKNMIWKQSLRIQDIDILKSTIS